MRGAPANALVNIALRDVNALLAEGIVIGDMRVASLSARLDERMIERALRPTSFDPHRAAAAAIAIRAASERLGAAEVRQAFGIAPAAQPKRRPIVVVPRVAAHPVHTVD